MARTPALYIDALEPIVLRLHRQDGLSARTIARKLQLARGTVNLIIHGHRNHHATNIPKKTEATLKSLPQKWCSTCRRLTPAPCVPCAARQWRREKGLPP